MRLSTIVDGELLSRARKQHGGRTDASLLEAALEALPREHREAAVDRDYLRAYQEHPVETRDEWGDLAPLLDAAAKL